MTPLLRPHLPNWVVFEGEVVDFWRYGDDRGYGALYDQWLRSAAEVAASHNPVLMVATALPKQLDVCPSRRCFTAIRTLGLVCALELQRSRLLARPAWRRSAAVVLVDDALVYTRRLTVMGEKAHAAFTPLDTSDATPAETALTVHGGAGIRGMHCAPAEAGGHRWSSTPRHGTVLSVTHSEGEEQHVRATVCHHAVEGPHQRRKTVAASGQPQKEGEVKAGYA